MLYRSACIVLCFIDLLSIGFVLWALSIGFVLYRQLYRRRLVLYRLVLYVLSTIDRLVLYRWLAIDGFAIGGVADRLSI